MNRRRDHYKLFSEGRIGPLTLPNRLVRSATWDPAILQARRMTDEVLDIYRRVAAGGVGLIITGDLSVVPHGLLDEDPPRPEAFAYEAVRIEGYDRLARTVHATAPDCKIVAQLSVDYPGVAPSDAPSPFAIERPRLLSTAQVRLLVHCLVESIAGIQREGFAGVQLHAAHGGLLSRFLSPYTNRRQDEYGGSTANRVRLVREVVAGARQKVGDLPILIKLNGTDYLPGGVDLDTFPDLAGEIAAAGVDAIEVSGGMWECLVRPEAELGFWPVPAAEFHTRLRDPDKQSYFLPYAERLSLDIPVILVGGNRDVERLEAILQRSAVDFVALCRPLISEPDLPRRWLEGRGGSSADCISVGAREHRLVGRAPACLVTFGGPDMSTINDQVDQLFAVWDRPDSPGCALAVIRQGEIVYKRAYGMADLERDVPLVLKLGYNPEQPPLEPTVRDEFSVKDKNLRFVRDEQGRLLGFCARAGRVKNLWFARTQAGQGGEGRSEVSCV